MAQNQRTQKAKVRGAEVEEKSQVDEILEQVDMDETFRIIDKKLNDEIRHGVSTHYRQDLIYNMPRKSKTGKKTHRECDLMPSKCKYKGNDPHIHILGVGIKGALTAMRSYGRMEADVPDAPELIEEGGRNYWRVYATVMDNHTGNSIGRWYLEPALKKAGSAFIENEFAPSCAQSKALRNVILALLPSGLMEQWIEDYKSGKKAFSVDRAREAGYGPKEGTKQPKAKERKSEPEKEKSKVQQPGEKDLNAITAQLAEKMDVPTGEMVAFGLHFFDTMAQTTLMFNRALKDDPEGTATLETLTKEFATWKESGGKAAPEEQDEFEME